MGKPISVVTTCFIVIEYHWGNILDQKTFCDLKIPSLVHIKKKLESVRSKEMT